MKNKSARHKETNTFKFQPFSERISNINVDIFHRVAHEYETQDEEESYFHQCIEKWNVLNLTESYGLFKRDVKAHTIITLPQLLHSKDPVIDVLIKHMKLKNPLSLQPLLEIVIATARDLRNDFYPYYQEIVGVLIELLNTKDTDQLEWAFHCLAYLFKFLWRALVKDINSVLKTLLPLLSDRYPQYINSFAAESFAFVARKVKDRQSFLESIFKGIKRNKEGIEGCGKLLFEVINGVTGQFHSCADTFLPFLLELPSNEVFPKEELQEVLECVIGNVVNNIQPDKGSLLWDTYYSLLEKIIGKFSNGEITASANLHVILILIGQSLEYKQGKFLTNSSKLINLIIKTISLKEICEDDLQNTAKIVILLLVSRNIKLQQDEASRLISCALKIPNEQVFLYFIENVLSYSSFEALILPTFLKACAEQDLKKDYLKILTKMLVEKSPLSKDGISLDTWNKYPVDFGKHNDKLLTIFEEYLKSSDLDLYISSLICIPHLLGEINHFTTTLKQRFLNTSLIRDGTDSSEIRIELFILHNILESLVHANNASDLLDLKEVIMQSILPLCSNIDYVVALVILDLYLSKVKDLETVINIEALQKIHEILEPHFSSPYHKVRLLTSHIYTLFEPILNIDGSWQIFTLCYNVESIQSQVDSYRNQLQQLEKLNFDKPQISVCKGTTYEKIPLRYLCGVLYMNFQLLWDPVINIIESHAHGMAIDLFWEIYSVELRKSVENVKSSHILMCDTFSTDCQYVTDLYEDVNKIGGVPDFANYRLLLWTALTKFADVAESKTRDVSALLLGFIEEEYMKSNSAVAYLWNIKQKSTESLEETMEIDEVEEDETEKIKNELKKPTPMTGGKYNLKLLLQHLTVFSKIRSPKSMYREQELYKLYFDMLSHKNYQIQKAALDCIFTYKFKYLTPYKENLYNLVDDKNFKNEISTFRVDKESSLIQEEHRTDLIPVVMRIVFSKMVAKTGQRTGGKSSGQFRRNLILRFLAGCKNEEMVLFIHMAFKYYSKFVVDDIEAMIGNIITTVDLEKYVPPKRMQSSLNLLTVVIEQFGNLMGTNVLKFLLKVLLCIGAFLNGAFLQGDDIHVGYLAILRNLRTAAVKILERFFNHFETYPWALEEINSVFKVFIWPYLNKLNIEGIHSPTTLLKLLCLWGSNPRYSQLLVKHEGNDKNNYPLVHVIQLLTNPKAHMSVTNAIMEMVENLLTLTKDENEMENPIPIENVLPIEEHIIERLKIVDNLNYGSCILLPHVRSVLDKIRLKLETKSKGLNKRELSILSRISELVWEDDISDILLTLILPLLNKKCQSHEDEAVGQLITTVYNLIKNVLYPQNHLKRISPLFGYITNFESRKTLNNILLKMSTFHMQPVHDVIVELNAFDAKWVDQPDFTRRLAAFKKVEEICEKNELTIEFGVILIYNCYFMISSEKDLSLRENATHCLRLVSLNLIKKYENVDKDKSYIIDEILLTLIRNTFKLKNDDLRNECISFLGYLARECPNSHTVLRDLHKLTNKNDLEVDFFENLIHLQSHRHARALLRFTQVFKAEENKPNTRTLTQFILPLATQYLCVERYMNKHSLIDNAIEAVSTVARFLPWHQYENILKYYLTKLRYKVIFQKQLVKLIVHILDAFHYDLSKAQALHEINEASMDDKIAEAKLNDTSKPADEVKELDDTSKTEDEIKEQELDDIIDENNLEEDEEEKVSDKINSYDKVTILCKSSATRVTKSIQTVLLPQLQRALAELSTHDTSHKVNRKKDGRDSEEEDLLRVPISLAVVKLLQKLPKEILDFNLPSVFMKLCTFLKSQLESIRRTARETLQKIMLALGPSYLQVLLEEMATLLSRGYQVHVLVYTTHSILCSLKEMYKRGDMDKILLTILDMCKADLFGNLAEEKEIAKIASKTSEAKSTKSFDTYQIVAQFVTDKCLMNLVLPIKTVLNTSHSYKMVNKCQDCLKHIALGLIDNEFIEIESLLKFAYGTASESIPQLLSKAKPVMTQTEREKLERFKPDCFILPKQPISRSSFRQNVKGNSKMNSHVLVEFGIRLCSFLLKRDKLKEGDYNPFLDPFINVFKNCLSSQHVKLSTVTLQCLQWVFKFDLPSLRDNVKDISKLLFDILHKYAAAGLSKGDNFDLVVAAFKAMSILVRDVKYHTIDTDQLKILILYVEQDLHDYEKQAIAFNLLKAIISRKLDVSEIHCVMLKVAELSITSELTHVRLQSRVVFLHYLMDYPLGKKLEKHISFYLAQLNYEVQSGRESALEMIQSMIHSFPIKILKDFSGTFFITLGARLVNDDVPLCRKMAASCITTMINKLEAEDRNQLFDIILAWMKNKKIAHKRLAAQLCGLFISVEKSSFETRLSSLVPLILLQFGLNEEEEMPGRFVLLQKPEEESGDVKERNKDHHLYQVLQMILKLCNSCPSFLMRTNDIENLSSHIQTLLSYPHEWVRLAASQFLGFVLSSMDQQKLQDLLLTKERLDNGYLFTDPINSVKGLTLDLCDQLQPGIKSDLAEQVIKNLVFIAKVLQKIPINKTKSENDNNINLLWLIKRMRKIVNTEVVESADSIVLRTEVFKWIAGITTIINMDILKPTLNHLMAPLVREMITTEESNAPLRQLAKEVAGIIKKQIGLEMYTDLLSRLQQQLSVKRAERKRSRNQLAVTDPEMYAKKKIKQNEKKKEAKKRKIAKNKGTATFKKKKKADELEIDEII